MVLHQPEAPASRQYHQLLEQLLGEANDSRVLLFTALATGQGVTTVLLNLALAASRTPSRKVVVVDGNWKDPALAARLGLPDTPGLREVFLGQVALGQALRTVPGEALQVLPGACWACRELQPSARDALRWVLRWLRSRFDYIFLDAPAWDESPECLLLLSLCDAVYPVFQEAPALPARLHLLIETITQNGGQVRGVIQAALTAA